MILGTHMDVVRLSAPFSSPFLIAHSQTSIQGRNSKLRVGLRCLLSIGKEASNAMKGIFPISPLLLPVDWSFFPIAFLNGIRVQVKKVLPHQKVSFKERSSNFYSSRYRL